jgi:SNF2 family DNA or RNA helicase
MKAEMVAELKGHQLEAFNAAAKSMKLLQLANGAIYTDDEGNWTEAHKEKLDALASVIEEAAGAPVLVAYHFKSDLARLKKAFPKGRVLDQNPKTISDWNAGKIDLLFAHPASAGHGLNMQDGGNIIAFFGLNWNLEEHEQIIERIGPVRQMQAGHDRPVFIYYIVAVDTVDELVLDRLQTKRSVQDILLEAMR